MRKQHIFILAALIANASLYADVTLRYKTECKFNSAMPNAAASTKAMQNAMPAEVVHQFKDGKGYTSQGSMTSIYDFTKREITLLDRDGKRYAKLPAEQYMEVFAEAAMPPKNQEVRAMLDTIKARAEAKATGRTATILGIEAEEREIAITMEVPLPPDMPAPAGPLMRTVIHCWTAKAGEILRVPAVRELTGYDLFADATTNPLASLEKLAQQMPMIKDFAAIQKELQSGGTQVILRLQYETFMPMMAAMGKQAPAGDPGAPMIEMTQEAIELSSAPVSGSVFEIPGDYQSASAAEIMKDRIQRDKAGMQRD